ncbi:MAG TPA: LON peptidase substrate-binding domain-containing protein, partial [Gemmatimonadaceae bacterium]|nr:LON peptidase substrate-binding domain-containing protein [Gemmatimonadaceae bacterium]
MAIELTRSGETITVEDRLPVLPLRDVVIYPYVVMPLLVGRAGSLAAVDAALAGDGHLLLVTQKRGDVQDPAASDLYRTGVVARIQQSSRLANGTVKVLVEGVAATRITRYATAGGVLRGTVAPVPLDGFAGAAGGDHAEARRALAVFEEYVSLQRRL